MKFSTIAMTSVAILASTLSFSTERWRVPVGIPTNLPGIGDGLIRITEVVEKNTDGEVQMKLFEPGELVPPFAVLDAVKEGKLPAGVHVMQYSAGKIPAGDLLTGYPFGLGPIEYLSWYKAGGGEALTKELLAKEGVHGMACLMIGAETGGWYNKEVNSTNDYKGLKYRTSGLGGAVLTELGASIASLPMGETFQALDKGAIDAAEASLPSVDTIIGFQKVTKYIYFPGWQQPVGVGHLVINQQVWDRLKPKVQNQIEVACEAVLASNVGISATYQAKALQTIRDAGVEIKTLNPELLSSLRRATDKVLNEKSSQDADFKRIYESMEQHKNLLSEIQKINSVSSH